MTGIVYIGENTIGTADFKISDESMGGIIGDFIPNEFYQTYKKQIQSISEKRGIANITDFNFRILIDNKELEPVGGIGITDLKEFDEIVIESVGNRQEIIERIKEEASR